jgi:hypothetical protein
MTAGRLAAVAPAATTNTVLYSSDIADTTSAVVHVCERGGSAGTYRIGHKNYSQKLTLDANTYKFQKGNVVSKYQIEINPGLTVGDATPGLAIIGDQSNFTAKIADVVRTTTTTTYYTKVATTGEVGIDSASIAGTFQGGETLTAGTSALTATYRGQTATGFQIELADFAQAATSLKVSSAANFNANDYIVMDADNASAEIMTVTAAAFYSGTAGGGTLTVTRGSLGTSDVAHTAGQYITAYTPSGTTTTINEGAPFAAGDTTLTVTSGVAVLSGSYIVVGNEVMLATAVNGNDLTVTRGQWGTTDAQHADGATVTPLTAAGSSAANWFDGAGESLTGGTSGAAVNTQGAPTIDVAFSPKFIWSSTSGQEVVPSATFSLNVDQTYKFDLSDSSNTGLPFRFSDVSEGVNATPTPGVEYTTGVTKVGTPGSAGCHITIEIASGTPDPIFYYADGTSGYSASIDINPDPTFTQIYVYDVVGTPATGNTFLVGTAAQTIGTPTPGAFGYVSAWDGTGGVLSVFVDNDSPAFFAATDTFPDTPPTQGETRTIATVSSVTGATDLSNEDYVWYDAAIAANATNEHKGLVVGPGSHLIVYASSADMSFQVNGFVNTVSDFEIVDYVAPAGVTGGAEGGGGGTPPPAP